jgi:hypothetical protein
MKIDKFEDLIAWQEARKLMNLIKELFNSAYEQSIKTSKLINGLIKNVNAQMDK